MFKTGDIIKVQNSSLDDMYTKCMIICLSKHYDATKALLINGENKSYLGCFKLTNLDHKNQYAKITWVSSIPFIWLKFKIKAIIGDVFKRGKIRLKNVQTG